MSARLTQGIPTSARPAWDGVRRVREPLGWALLGFAALDVIVSAWELLGLPGTPALSGPTATPVSSVAAGTPAPVSSSGPPSPAGAAHGVLSPFMQRASEFAPQFVTGGLVLLPILAVLLAVFAAGPIGRARTLMATATTVQAVALGLGALTWVVALLARSASGVGLRRTPIWLVFDAADLGVAAAALVFTVAVARSRAMRSAVPPGFTRLP